MVDLHTHILPGIDDGAKNWEIAVEMVRMAADGIRHMVAIPHSNDEYRYDRGAFTELVEELRSRTCNTIELSLGCDFNFSFENIEAALQSPARFCISGSPYLSSPLLKVGDDHFESLVSLPQHSGRSGKTERSQPPPRAWTRVTASTMRRPRMLTAVSSSERAALWAVVTSR
jgi:hypothetical protein